MPSHTGGGGSSGPLNKFDATTAPTVNNDTTEGYSVGSRWLDVTNDEAYICLDATDGAAVWVKSTAGLASEIVNTPAGNIVATNVQAALNELDSEKANDADVVHDTGNETIAGVKTFSSDPIIPDEAYDATAWNGSLEPPTKNAVRDKFESLSGGGLALLGETILGAGAAFVEVASFTGKKNLVIFADLKLTASDSISMRFNGSTAGYDSSTIEDNGAAATLAGSSRIVLSDESNASEAFYSIHINNQATYDKRGTFNGMRGAIGGAPQLIQGGLAWAETTNQITTIRIYTGGGSNFDAGTKLTVFGSD